MNLVTGGTGMVGMHLIAGLLRRGARVRAIIRSGSSHAATDACSVLKRSGGTRCFTGATGSERDAWTLRLGPTGATAIWLGFDKPAAIAREARLKSLLDEFVQGLGNN
jgi:uncharacterized protein YbjT (DUF2867 family)